MRSPTVVVRRMMRTSVIQSKSVALCNKQRLSQITASPIVAEALRAEHEQVTTQKRVVESGEEVVIGRLRQIDADHFGTQYRVERTDSEPGWQTAWCH